LTEQLDGKAAKAGSFGDDLQTEIVRKHDDDPDDLAAFRVETVGQLIAIVYYNAQTGLNMHTALASEHNRLEPVISYLAYQICTP